MSMSIREELEADKAIVSLTELIENRLYFVTIKNKSPHDTKHIHFFSSNEDSDRAQQLNLASIAKYLKQVNSKLSSPDLKAVVHYSSGSEKRRRNAAICIGVYSMIYMKQLPSEVAENLSQHTSSYPIIFLNALHKALQLGFVNFEDFNEDDFTSLDNIKLNWVIPQKFVLFFGPVSSFKGRYFSPKRYIKYFRQTGVKTMIRLSHLKYDANPFVNSGLCHYDLNMEATVPSQQDVSSFLEICESNEGAVVTHCRDVLGCSGALVSTYLIKHYCLTAEEAFAWIRLCNPNCVLEVQRSWLGKIESSLNESGDEFRRKLGMPDLIPHHKSGVYSYISEERQDRNKTSRTTRARKWFGQR